MTALLGNEVQMMMATRRSPWPDEGESRESAGRREPQTFHTGPRVADDSEQGLPGVETDTWYGVLAPARVPAAIVEEVQCGCE